MKRMKITPVDSNEVTYKCASYSCQYIVKYGKQQGYTIKCPQCGGRAVRQ